MCQPNPHQTAFLFESQALGDRESVEVPVLCGLFVERSLCPFRAPAQCLLFAVYCQRQQFFAGLAV